MAEIDEERYIFKLYQIKNKAHEEDRDNTVKRILFFRLVYLIALGIWLLITIEHRVSYVLYDFITATLWFFILFFETAFKKDIDSFGIFKISNSGIYIEYLDRLCRTHRDFLKLKDIKKIKVDGKKGEITIRTIDKKEVIFRTNKENLRTLFFQSNQLDDFKEVLNRLEIEHEIKYP